jgi:hypothetical protein
VAGGQGARERKERRWDDEEGDVERKEEWITRGEERR